ncbi:MAG: bifunctional glutamate N-acetyltransferase/amino-acid acetyltransferase ArgJ [Ardenticatenales bacterium]|nr:bifunctional glutamate N-acetyltransferase/amino-acid acetyltransferase ArgJ [Ardenticatenales bacterium]
MSKIGGSFVHLDGDVTTPLGFRAAAATCGLKASGAPDIALVVSDVEASAAGMFTQNAFAAAPVRLDRTTLRASGGRARAVIANSGNANAVTGPAGDAAAAAMQRAAASALACPPEHVLVLSTGVIGVPLDIAKVERGIAQAQDALTNDALSGDGGRAAARAIMTTDTRPKTAARRVRLSGGDVLVGGMAKGAGMIHPDMATMLAVLTTDLHRAPADLAADLAAAVGVSFNRISIDGDTSTNDSVILLANGASGVVVADAEIDVVTTADVVTWRAALDDLCQDLARQIVRDGEGVRKLAVIVVTGAADDDGARRVANAVATSPLVKTAFAGGDPNWGRIVAAAGRAGVAVDPARVSLTLAPGEHDVDGASAPVIVLAHGLPTGFDEAAAAALLADNAFRVLLDLGLGDGTATVWTGDLTEEYVRINADYRT